MRKKICDYLKLWIYCLFAKISMIFIPILSVALILFDKYVLQSKLTLMEMNLLFLLLFLMGFLSFIHKYLDKLRMGWLVSMITISLVSIVFNVDKRQVSPISSPIKFINSYCGFWLVVFLVTLIYFLITYGDSDLNDIREKCKKQDLKSMIFTVIAVVILPVLYIGLPNLYAKTIINEKVSWLHKVAFFTSEFTKVDSKELNSDGAIIEESKYKDNYSKSEKEALVENALCNYEVPDNAIVRNPALNAIIRYTLIVISLLSVVAIGLMLLWKFVNQFAYKVLRGQPIEEDVQDFFSNYTTPIIILIVAFAMLFTMTTGKIEGNKFEKFFSDLMKIVSMMVLILIAIDVVKIIMEQCSQKGSLLRTFMHLSFVLLMKSTMGIVLGILSGLNLKELISDVLSAFTQSDNYKFNQKIESIMNKAYKMEMRNINRNLKRGNKKRNKNLFKEFHGKWRNY